MFSVNTRSAIASIPMPARYSTAAPSAKMPPNAGQPISTRRASERTVKCAFSIRNGRSTLIQPMARAGRFANSSRLTYRKPMP